MPRKAKEKFRTFENVFDNFTLRTLFQLESSGLFDKLESPIALGKEANVFSALKGDERICVKIYRLEACDFKRMYEYIRTDPRYQELKHQRRKTIFSWTQREFRNLLKAREAGVNCPKPMKFKNNVLLMEFIGQEKAYPLLRQAPPEDVEKFFKKTIEEIKKLYKGNLIHGDLSEYNILNREDSPVFIDFSHGTQLNNPRAKELFDRDIKNVCNYFKRLGLKIEEKKIKEEIIGKV